MCYNASAVTAAAAANAVLYVVDTNTGEYSHYAEFPYACTPKIGKTTSKCANLMPSICSALSRSRKIKPSYNKICLACINKVKSLVMCI